MVERRRLNLTSSIVSTVFILSSNITGYITPTFWKKGGGRRKKVEGKCENMFADPHSARQHELTSTQ
jgi:hypothetical protein